MYWFKFILRLLWKILIKGEELEDNREYDEEEKKRSKEAGNGGLKKTDVEKKKE